MVVVVRMTVLVVVRVARRRPAALRLPRSQSSTRRRKTLIPTATTRSAAIRFIHG